MVKRIKELVYSSRGDAEEVVDGLLDLIDTYGEASLQDYYELSGIISNFTLAKWGWKDISKTVAVTRTRNGYTIYLPELILLDSDEDEDDVINRMAGADYDGDKHPGDDRSTTTKTDFDKILEESFKAALDGVETEMADGFSKNGLLNPYGEYVVTFAKAHKLSIDEAIGHQICKARLDHFVSTGR